MTPEQKEKKILISMLRNTANQLEGQLAKELEASHLNKPAKRVNKKQERITDMLIKLNSYGARGRKSYSAKQRSF
jgi:hypothetical protein